MTKKVLRIIRIDRHSTEVIAPRLVIVIHRDNTS
nr:MAG TPA: hypothetical protein [Bacteriophage sp.]